jgi:hypothetical protein
MIKQIQSFLFKECRIIKNPSGFFIVVNSHNNEILYWSDLRQDLANIFSLEELTIKSIVIDWGKIISGHVFDLNDYFNLKKPELPTISRLISSLISNDLVPVQSMSAPNPNLLFLDIQPDFRGEMCRMIENNPNKIKIFGFNDNFK